MQEESDLSMLRIATREFIADHPLADMLMAPELWWYARKCFVKDPSDLTAKQLIDLVSESGDGLPPVIRIVESQHTDYPN